MERSGGDPTTDRLLADAEELRGLTNGKSSGAGRLRSAIGDMVRWRHVPLCGRVPDDLIRESFFGGAAREKAHESNDPGVGRLGRSVPLGVRFQNRMT